MGIRVEHGSVADFAQLGALAGQAAKADREAERADRQRLALMEMDLRQSLAQQELQVKMGMAQDAMEFERTQAQARREFQLGMQLQSEQNDFQREERKRMEEQEKFDATMAAIDARDDYSPQEKEDMKMMVTAERAGTPIPQRAVYDTSVEKTNIQLNRLFLINDRLDKQMDRAAQLAGQFSKETKGIFRKKTVLVRQEGKNKMEATPDEAAQYQRAVQEIQDTLKQKALIDQKIESLMGVTKSDAGTETVDQVADPKERVKQLVNQERPETEAERRAVYIELHTMNPLATKALMDKWEREEEETKPSPRVNNNASNYRIPRMYTQSMGSFR